MATTPLSIRLARTWRTLNGPSICNSCARSKRLVSTQAIAASDDPMVDLVEQSDSSMRQHSPIASAEAYDPVGRAKERKWQLPPSRYWLPILCLLHESNTTSSDTSFVHPSTTADPSIPINHPIPPTLPPASSSQGPSPPPASNPPTTI